jgi:hypothetical protein
MAKLATWKHCLENYLYNVCEEGLRGLGVKFCFFYSFHYATYIKRTTTLFSAFSYFVHKGKAKVVPVHTMKSLCVIGHS